MLLIDALFINNGGGKSLLDVLVNEVNKRGLKVMYLIDERIASDYRPLNLDNVTFLEPSLIRRHLYYLKNKNYITSVLAFGNVPPSVKLKCKVFTYFHNVMYLESWQSLQMINVLPNRLKSIFIRQIKGNTTNWIVQSKFIKDKMVAKWGISKNDILIYPIYDNRFVTRSCRKELNEAQGIKFIYISNGHFYKNHILLIEAFSVYNKLYPGSSLTLTIGEEFPKLKQIIKKAVHRGVNVIDKGIISFKELKIEYENADICVYPTLFESFGLGLIEAALLKMPILASDLPFVYEVVKPNSVFNPNSKESIIDSLLFAHSFKNARAELICKNKVEELIDVISV